MAAVVLAAFALPFVLQAMDRGKTAALLSLGLFAVALWPRARWLIAVAAVVLGWFGGLEVVRLLGGPRYPFTHLIQVGLCLVTVGLLEPVARAKSTLRWGRVRGLVLYSLAVTAVALAGLGAWLVTMGQHLVGRDVVLPPGAVNVIGIGAVFAFGNAMAEEIVYRGMLLTGLRGRFSDPWAIFLSAAAFGLAHFAAGIPGGVSGIALTFGFGLMTAWLAIRARGILLVWLCHAATDGLIFVWLCR